MLLSDGKGLDRAIRQDRKSNPGPPVTLNGTLHGPEQRTYHTQFPGKLLIKYDCTCFLSGCKNKHEILESTEQNIRRSECSKVAGYKVNMQKSIAFRSISSKQLEGKFYHIHEIF